MFDLKSYLNTERKRVDEALEAYILQLCPSEGLRAPLLYSVLAGGKRLRPILCLASFASVGGNGADALPAACALEFIHTYSLIHDDLPALDDDAVRRGQPTCHMQFNEATAILSGDALLNMAFEVLSETALKQNPTMASQWLRTIHVVATASGCLGMIEGQYRDLAMEGTTIKQDDLQNLHQLKTGALIRASVHCGALLGNSNDAQTTGLNQYAEHVGLAFQVVDDILNVTGDPQILGKAVGSDLIRKKNTYPGLMGLETSQQYARQLVDGALQALTIFDNKADPLRAIAKYIIERKR